VKGPESKDMWVGLSETFRRRQEFRN